MLYHAREEHYYVVQPFAKEANGGTDALREGGGGVCGGYGDGTDVVVDSTGNLAGVATYTGVGISGRSSGISRSCGSRGNCGSSSSRSISASGSGSG